MKLNNSHRLKIVGGTIFAMASVLATSEAVADKPTRWKMHVMYGEKAFLIGPAPRQLADNIKVMTGESLKIKVFNPGALVPGAKYYDAVKAGSIHAAWGVPGVNVAKNPAYGFIAGIPFGPGPNEYVSWFYDGGGEEIAQEIYARDGIKYHLCGMTPPETSGWFKKKIEKVEDLKGLKMRFYGIGARVMEKFGVSTQLLSAGDIYPALELGTIDATEFSMPAVDRSFGFYQIAKFNYFPGWHQPATTNELLINMKAWNKLSEQQQLVIKRECRATTLSMLSKGESTQSEYMRLNEKDGVENVQWSDEMLEAFRKASEEVMEEAAAENDDTKRLWASIKAFRKDFGLWKSKAYIK